MTIEQKRHCKRQVSNFSIVPNSLSHRGLSGRIVATLERGTRKQIDDLIKTHGKNKIVMVLGASPKLSSRAISVSKYLFHLADPHFKALRKKDLIHIG